MDRRSFFAAAPAVVAAGALPASSLAATAALNGKLINIVDDAGADPTGATDSTAKIQAAIDSVGGAGVVIAPPGTYTCSSTLTISNSNVAIVGHSRGSVFFKFPEGVSGFMVAPGTNNVEIRHLQIVSVGAKKTANTAGVYAVAPALNGGIGYLNLTDLDINGFDKGVDIRYAQLSSVDGCHLWANNIGYYSKRCVNMRLSSTISERNNLWAAFVDGDANYVNFSAGTLIKDCTLVSCGGSLTVETGTLQVAHNEYTSVIGCMIDVPRPNTQWHVLFTDCSRGCITGNWVGAAKSPRGGISLVNSHEFSISGNNVLTSENSGYGIGIENGRYNSIVSNIMKQNDGIDIIVFGTSSRGNTIGNNVCLSTVNANSIGETAAFKTIATGNSVVKGVLLNTTGGSIAANNLVVT